MSYKNATIFGVGWVTLLQLGTKVISLLKIIIVAKILSPYDFGVFSLVMTTLSLIEVFTETSMQTFMIQKKYEIKKIASSVWVLLLTRGVFLFLILLIGAYPLSVFFHSSQLFSLIIIASFIPLVKSLENPYVVLFQKELKFKREFFYRAAFVLVDCVVSISLVLLFRSVIGLVLGLFVSIVFGVAISWIFIKDKPTLNVNKRYIQEIHLFLKSIVPMNIMSFLANQWDVVFIGRVLGADQLGIYQLSQKFSSQPLIELSDVFGKVTFPVYAKIEKDRKRLFKAYKRIVRVLFALCLLSVCVIFVVSPFLIQFLGPQWSSASKVLPILTSYGFLMSLWGTTGALFLSVSAQKMLSKLALIRFIVTLILISILVVKIGIVGAAWGLLIGVVAVIPFTIYYSYILFHTK